MRGSDVRTFSANNSRIHKQSLGILNKASLVMSVDEKLRAISIEVFGQDYVLYTSSKIEIFGK